MELTIEGDRDDDDVDEDDDETKFSFFRKSARCKL